jgi:hypothetical protein
MSAKPTKTDLFEFLSFLFVAVLALFFAAKCSLELPAVAFDYLDMAKCIYIEKDGYKQPCDGLQLPNRYFTVLVDGANLPASLCADGYKQFCSPANKE